MNLIPFPFISLFDVDRINQVHQVTYHWCVKRHISPKTKGLQKKKEKYPLIDR